MELVRLPRRVLSVKGPDAAAFLDALLTNAVAPARPDRPIYAALLSPQGKLLCDIHVWGDGDGGFLLDSPESRAEDLLRRLKLYRLRAKVEIGEPSLAVVAGGGAIADPRRAALGPRGLSETAPDFDAAAFLAYEARRVRLGVADPSQDASPEEVFALEAQLEELNGVDFHKGCFVGQENVSRMKRRATTRRKFCRIGFDGAAPAFGGPIMAGAAELGSIRSGVDGAAIALLRLDRALAAVESGAQLRCGDTSVRLDPPDWLILPISTAEET